MVETSKGHSAFEKMLKHRGLVQIMLLPYLEPIELFKFARLNKKAMELLDPKSKHSINYKVLYKAQGHEVTSDSSDDESEYKKSLSSAL
jgi:hypothetical protein